MAEKTGVSLTSIMDFPTVVVEQLGSLWITTAEELVGAARQTGPEGLASYLSITVDEVTGLVNQAAEALPATVSYDFDGVMSVGFGALDEPEGEPLDTGPVAYAPITLPASISLAEQMSPVRNQQNRGTCVAHACAAVREYLLEKDEVKDDLSEQFLYWACKQQDGIPNIEGTFISTAMSVLEELGICPEQIWPYKPNKVQGNEGQGPPPITAVESAKPYRIQNGEKIWPKQVIALKQKLADGKPVAFAVPVYPYWLTNPVRTTGDVRMPLPGEDWPDKKTRGHAMCLVGYVDDPMVPGGGYFVLRNSWGTIWASKGEIPGYGRLPYAYMSEYGTAAYTATVLPNLTETGIFPVKSRSHTFYDWLRRLFGGH